jgi:hypothetical protein
MTEIEFFKQLQHLTVKQLATVHHKLLLLIKRNNDKQQALLKNAELERKAREEKTSQAKHTGNGLPKLPTNTKNVDDMADMLDLDISSLVREISKR